MHQYELNVGTLHSFPVLQLCEAETCLALYILPSGEAIDKVSVDTESAVLLIVYFQGGTNLAPNLEVPSMWIHMMCKVPLHFSGYFWAFVQGAVDPEHQ